MNTKKLFQKAILKHANFEETTKIVAQNFSTKFGSVKRNCHVPNI